MAHDPPCPGILLTSMTHDPTFRVFYLFLRPMILLPRVFYLFLWPMTLLAPVLYLLLCPMTLLPGLFNDVVELVIELVILSPRSSPGFNACTIKCLICKKSSKNMVISWGIYSHDKYPPPAHFRIIRNHL